MSLFQKILRSLIIFLAGIILGLAMFRWMIAHRGQSAAPILLPAEAPPAVTTNGHVIADFAFTERNGKTIRRADLLGSYWIADFFFTRCQGPCPLLTSMMGKLQREFPERTDLKFVSFTVDPDYDTPPVLSKYADTYGASKTRWYFLTGKKEAIYRLIQSSFQLAVASDESDPMQVVHSLSFVLVGKKGEILGRFNANDPEQLAELRKSLKALN